MALCTSHILFNDSSQWIPAVLLYHTNTCLHLHIWRLHSCKNFCHGPEYTVHTLHFSICSLNNVKNMKVASFPIPVLCSALPLLNPLLHHSLLKPFFLAATSFSIYVTVIWQACILTFLFINIKRSGFSTELVCFGYIVPSLYRFQTSASCQYYLGIAHFIAEGGGIQFLLHWHRWRWDMIGFLLGGSDFLENLCFVSFLQFPPACFTFHSDFH